MHPLPGFKAQLCYSSSGCCGQNPFTSVFLSLPNCKMGCNSKGYCGEWIWVDRHPVWGLAHSKCSVRISCCCLRMINRCISSFHRANHIFSSMAHGFATEEEKGGEEEWKNPASLVIVNTTVQRARKAGVSTIGSRIGGLAKMGGVAA